MAATTITRATITDDSGNGTSGTIINSAWVGSAIYDKIDALFSTRQDTRFEAGGTGTQSITIKQTAAGTGNASYLALGTDQADLAGFLAAYSSTYTTVTTGVANTTVLRSQLSNGLSLVASHATGAVRFYAGGTTKVGEFIPAGHFVVPELSANPTTSDLASGAAVAIYMKADTLVFAINDSGTMRYLSIALTGTGTTWTHGTAAP